MTHSSSIRRSWLVAGALIALVGCSLSEESALLTEDVAPQEPVVLKVEVIEVQPVESVFRTASAFGTVKPSRSSYVGFAKGGRVAGVFAEVGEEVVVDQQLAALEQQDLQDQFDQLNESIESIRDRLGRLSPNSRSTNVQNQRNRLNQDIATLEAQQQELQRELDKGIIKAPFQAVVAERNVDVGTQHPPGRPAFKLVEDVAPIVELQVGLELAEQVDVDQQVWIDTGKQLVEARVAAKSPELSRSSLTQPLTLEFVEEDPNQKWVYGESVEARFWLSSEETGIWLPYSALQRQFEGLWSTLVVVQKDEQQLVERRIIDIIQLVDDFALVRGALQAGDMVIVDGSNRIVSGQEVVPRIVPAPLTQIGPPESPAGVTEPAE